MSDHINLLSHKRKNLLSREFLAKILQLLAQVSLVVTIITSIVLFILNSSGKLPILEQQNKIISGNLSAEQQKIIKFLLIRERIKDISPLLSKKSQIDNILSQISDAIPTDASLDSFTLSQKTITMTVSSQSLISLNTFLDFAIAKVNKKELFKKVTITGLTTDSSSNKYILTLSTLYYE